MVCKKGVSLAGGMDPWQAAAEPRTLRLRLKDDTAFSGSGFSVIYLTSIDSSPSPPPPSTAPSPPQFEDCEMLTAMTSSRNGMIRERGKGGQRRGMKGGEGAGERKGRRRERVRERGAASGIEGNNGRDVRRRPARGAIFLFFSPLSFFS